ncbi:MAG: hypothetical protein WKG01_18020 [Kofleriaceae bacterium]
MWARVHKIDRIRPQPGGGGIVLVEDERNAAAMGRVPGLSTVIAVARVLNARRALEARFAGKGEVRYATGVMPPPVLVDAITRAGAAISDARGERIQMPAGSGAISSIIDHAFAELAHRVRTNFGVLDMATALAKLEAQHRKAPLDRDGNPAAYWSAVFEIAALAGEQSRKRGGRWIETTDTPVPFAIQFPDHKQATPAKLAQQIVEGTSPDGSLTGEP